MTLRGSLQRLRYCTHTLLFSPFSLNSKVSESDRSLLCSSASSLIPVPPVSQWHDHTPVVRKPLISSSDVDVGREKRDNDLDYILK